MRKIKSFIQTDRRNYVITEEESKRIQILKLWLTIMVLFIHSYSETVNFLGTSIELQVPTWLYWTKYVFSGAISGCAVPGFFFIAAILLYRKEFKWIENIKKKTKTLLVPYLILNTFWIVFFVLAPKIGFLKPFFSNKGIDVQTWGILDFLDAYLGINSSGYPILYPLWFVLNLMVLNLLAVVLRKIIDRFPRIIFICLMILMVKGINIAFCLNQTALVYFCLGYYFVKYERHLIDLKINKIVLFITYIGIIIINCLTRETIIHFSVVNLTIVLGFVFFFVCTTKINNNKIEGFVLWLSKYSFPVYLFHEMATTMLKKIVTKVFPTTTFFQLVEYIGIPIFVFAFCIILSVMMNKFVPSLYALITGGRKK